MEKRIRKKKRKKEEEDEGSFLKKTQEDVNFVVFLLPPKLH